MENELAKKRSARRNDANISSDYNTAFGREKTMAGNLTAEDQNKYMQAIKKNLEDNQRKSILDRKSFVDRLQDRISQV